MTIQSRPIPALYTVYVLRSTVRHASLYIGSTPNPPRRLKQHNGQAKGGAARTSRSSLRPWEMVALVSGFPSMVAALKFEWALTNPHLSLHIPSESRISKSAGVKRNGHPKRPRPGLNSIMSNLHLLLRVPSFTRWPLSLHFFVRAAHAAWETSCGASDDATALEDLSIQTDFDELEARDATAEEARGIHALPLDYAPLKDYAEKARSIFSFEREGDCIACKEGLMRGDAGGLQVVCPNDGCEGVGHIACWSRHLLGSEATDGDDTIMPKQGRCPSCGGAVRWSDMMRELTLRERGEKEVDKLLKAKKKRQAKANE